MEYIKKQIRRNAVGKRIKCKFCENPEAIIILEEGRLWVRCLEHQDQYLLKTQHYEYKNL